MSDTQTLQVQTHAQGAVPDEAMDLAVLRLRSVLRLAHEPVLFARIKLTMAADPAVEMPAVAQANVDLNGRPVRAQASAATIRDAIEMLGDKLRIQLERAARNWARIRGSVPTGEPGEWRHQSVPSARLPNFPRPTDERAVVRHKSYGLARMTPDQAIADMELLDYDFHLFTERVTGQDTVVYRNGDGYRLAQLHPRPGLAGSLGEGVVAGEGVNVREGVGAGGGVASGEGAAVGGEVTLSEVGAPKLGLGEAEERLEALGQPFLFFENAESRRGNLLYHRYDGDYGLITPADA
ncbi:MAG TPA: sigma 54 modulation/S30EA ribosomal C-terminal domain-containing protein [Streptosporangiaceae bacterium]|nr:sigma 54 modulation/S30EA ribosomal C-terminal domain-containing protein [Streptosporangiaceae bacterium]